LEEQLKPPAFQFYPDDFLGGTAKFSDAEVGLYVRLLCAQWSEGGLTDDDADLRSYGKPSAEGVTPIERIKAKFTKAEDGKLRQRRLEEEREKQRLYRESRSNNGKHGGRPSKACANHVVSQTKAQESSPSPSPSPIGTQTNSEFPKLEAVIQFAGMRGITREAAEQFWHHFESAGWVDKNGHEIKSWTSKLMTWKVTQQSKDGRQFPVVKEPTLMDKEAARQLAEVKRFCATK
jgi:uncharacterized protein YdaU (DUF1376 family)